MWSAKWWRYCLSPKVKISSYWYQRKPYLEWKLQRDLPEEEEKICKLTCEVILVILLDAMLKTITSDIFGILHIKCYQMFTSFTSRISQYPAVPSASNRKVVPHVCLVDTEMHIGINAMLYVKWMSLSGDGMEWHGADNMADIVTGCIVNSPWFNEQSGCGWGEAKFNDAHIAVLQSMNQGPSFMNEFFIAIQIHIYIYIIQWSCNQINFPLVLKWFGRNNVYSLQNFLNDRKQACAGH